MTEKMHNILLAEDDYFIKKAYTAGLTHAGFHVFVAGDGEEAMALIKKESPDLILLDLILPKKDGFWVLQEIKTDDALKHIPVIILSNLGQPKDITECKKLGAVDYFVKSDTPLFRLIEIIKKYLQSPI